MGKGRDEKVMIVGFDVVRNGAEVEEQHCPLDVIMESKENSTI